MKETTIDQTLVLCDLDSLLLDAAGNLPQLQRDVLQLFASRGGRLTVFSQRSPRAVRSLLGGVRLSAPALVCGGTLAYNFSEGSGTALCSFEGMEESVLKILPSLSGVGIALQTVLGDNGHLYSKMTQEMVEEMRRLACRADVLTPNLTEAFALLDRPYKTDCTTEELKDLIAELSEMGPDTVIITGVPVPGQSGLTSVIARSKSDLRTWKVTCPYLPAHYPGTGDSFTSVITGSLLQGDSLPIALDRAAQFILQGIRSTFGYRMDNRDGILLERVLPNLNTPIQSATYELV